MQHLCMKSELKKLLSTVWKDSSKGDYGGQTWKVECCSCHLCGCSMDWINYTACWTNCIWYVNILMEFIAWIVFTFWKCSPFLFSWSTSVACTKWRTHFLLCRLCSVVIRYHRNVFFWGMRHRFMLLCAELVAIKVDTPYCMLKNCLKVQSLHWSAVLMEVGEYFALLGQRILLGFW